MSIERLANIIEDIIIEDIKISKDENNIKLKKTIKRIVESYYDSWENEHLPLIKEFYSKATRSIPILVLSVCGTGTQEIRYSKYLAYFLAENSLYGIGNKFLRSILEIIDSNINDKIIEMKDGTIISTKINIKPMKKNKVIYNLKCSMFMKKLEQSTKVYARRAENNPIAFEAYINTQNRIKNVEIDDIFTLLEIIESGKVKFPVSSLTFTLKKLT